MVSELCVMKRRTNRMRLEIISLKEQRLVSDKMSREIANLIAIYNVEIEEYVNMIGDAYKILATASEREKEIFECRYVFGHTWEEVALECKMTKQEAYKVDKRLQVIFSDAGRWDILKMC